MRIKNRATKKSDGLAVRTGLKAGRLAQNHNRRARAVVRQTARASR